MSEGQGIEILLAMYDQEVVKGKVQSKFIPEEFSLTDSQLRDALNDLQVSGYISRIGQIYARLTEYGKVVAEGLVHP